MKTSELLINSAQTIPLADTWSMHGGDIGVGWWIVMMVGMVLFWGAIVLGVLWIIRGGSDGRPEWRRETPTQVLERRFAEGVISADDYQARRELLASGSADPSGRARREEHPAAAGAGEAKD